MKHIFSVIVVVLAGFSLMALYTQTGQTPIDGKTANITDTTPTTIIAEVAGQRTYIGQITCINSHASVGTWVHLDNNSVSRWPLYLGPAGGGATVNFNERSMLRGAVNQAWTVTAETTGANYRCAASGYSNVEG